MVSTFEFISASFALFYLRETHGASTAARLFCKYFPIAWNLIGFVLYLGWYGARGSGNWCEPVAIAAAYVAACAVLTEHDAWRERFENEALRGVAAMHARHFYQCYVHGVPWRIPLRAPPQDAEPLLMPGLAEVNAELRARLAVLLRYAEYTITASFLYVGVLSIFVVGPPSWAFVAGFTGIFVCNASGLALHVIHTEQAIGPVVFGNITANPPSQQPQTTAPPQPRVYASSVLRVPIIASVGRRPRAVSQQNEQQSSRRTRNPGHVLAAVFGAGTWHEHWVAKLELLKAAWFGLAVGIFIVIYFGRGYLFNGAMPTFVLFILWNLLVQYSLFGIVGTVFYAYDRIWPWMEPSLDILSLAAKVPIAISVAISFLQMPGGAC